MHIICADPSKTGAFIAILSENNDGSISWRYHKIEIAQEYPNNDLWELHNLLAELSNGNQPQAAFFCCEAQFVNVNPHRPKESGAKARDALLLARVRGYLEAVANLAGCTVFPAMLASDWQPKILKRLGNPIMRQRETIEIATQLTGKKPDHGGFADAVCMCQVIYQQILNRMYETMQ